AVGPALQGTRADLARNLSMGAGASSARRSRARALLAVAQTALSVVLLVGAGLFVKSVSEVRRLDLGLDVDRLLLAELELESDDLAAGERTDLSEAQRLNPIHLAAMERVSHLPGVQAVAVTASPFGSSYAITLKVPGLDSFPRLPGGGPYLHDVTPGYLETVGLRVVAGRPLRDSDGASAPKVTVVSETTARALWPGEDPLGKVVLIGDKEAFTVVGVVQDAARQALREEPFMAFYQPIAQRPERDLKELYIRWSGRKAELSELTTAVASALRSAGSDVRYATVRPLREILDPQARSWTLGATLFTVFGVLALVVAAVGLYSVLAFDVAQRTRELGIRSALGAEKARLLGAVVASGVRLAAAGVAIGLGVALVAAPYVKELLFDVSPRDPAVLVGVAFTLLATALVAGFLPALRATRVDPMVALRSE
ncbi:MAG: FtsX-like permease family protein, partial [Longimicrobiales bacterium]